MELQKLYNDKHELQCDKTMWEKRKQAIQDKVGVKATNYSGDRVQGGVARNSQEEAILIMCDMDREISCIDKQLEAIIERINIALQGIDETIPSILEKKAEGKDKNWVIARDLGIGEATLYRKLKLIRENDINLIEKETETAVK